MQRGRAVCFCFVHMGLRSTVNVTFPASTFPGSSVDDRTSVVYHSIVLIVFRAHSTLEGGEGTLPQFCLHFFSHTRHASAFLPGLSGLQSIPSVAKLGKSSCLGWRAMNHEHEALRTPTLPLLFCFHTSGTTPQWAATLTNLRLSP